MKIIYSIIITGLAIAACNESPGSHTTIYPSATTVKPGEIKHVIELFTSGGCSSCPAAEKYLQGLAVKDPSVLLLAFHVDYWNRLGWVDSFSTHAFTQRQIRYTNLFKLNTMYTPQAVINGEHEIVGSNAKAISNLIQDSGLQHRIIEGKLKGWHTSDTAWAQVNLNNEDPSLETILLLVQKEAVTKINAGENDGKKLQHINIVRAMQVMKKDKDGLIASIKYSPNLTEKDVRLIVLVQDKKTGLVKDVGIVGSWRLMISASF